MIYSVDENARAFMRGPILGCSLAVGHVTLTHAVVVQLHPAQPKPSRTKFGKVLLFHSFICPKFLTSYADREKGKTSVLLSFHEKALARGQVLFCVTGGYRSVKNGWRDEISAADV